MTSLHGQEALLTTKMASLHQSFQTWSLLLLLCLLPLACLSQDESPSPKPNQSPEIAEIPKLVAFLVQSLANLLESTLVDPSSPMAGMIKGAINSMVLPNLDKYGTTAVMNAITVVHGYVHSLQMLFLPVTTGWACALSAAAFRLLDQAEDALLEMRGKLLPLQGPR